MRKYNIRPESLSYTETMSRLHSDAMEEVKDILRNQEGSRVDFSTEDPDYGIIMPGLWVMFEAGKTENGTFNFNSQFAVFAVRLLEDDLQILVPYDQYMRILPPLRPCPADETDTHGNAFKWTYYPDHYYGEILQVADLLRRKCPRKKD